MNSSLLFHAYGIKEYYYSGTTSKENSTFLNLRHSEPKKYVCPHCGGIHVIKYGIAKRNIRNLPFGGKRCYLSLTIQRYHARF